ncbi:MAG: hypothetical protein ACLP7P_06650 [Rhodomicrobium sp.]
MLSFKVFLKSRQMSDDSACDVLRGFSEGGGFPDAATWPDIHNLLTEKRACPRALATIRRLWLDYQKLVNARRTGKDLVADNTKLKETAVARPCELVERNEDSGIACSCAGRRSDERLHEPRSALSTAYLRYKIVEFLQPHPSYEYDDGFQPQSIIGYAIECDCSTRQLVAEVEGNSLIAVLTELIESGEVILTPYEPANGDFMLGLPENLGKRKAAHEERKWLIVEGAARCGLRVKWNEDGTGWLETPDGAIAGPAGSVWDLLSYLNNPPAAAELPQLLN